MGLQLPDLTPASRDGLNGVLKGFGWAANPADVTTYANSDAFPEIMRYMIEGPEVGMLAIASAGGDSQAQQVIAMRDAMDKPLAFLWTGSLTATDGLNKLKEAKIPVFLSPDRLARGLRSKINSQRWRERLLKGAGEPLQPLSVWQREALQELHGLGRKTLTEHEARHFLTHWQVTGVREERTTTIEGALATAGQLGYPVVLKVESPDIPHKTEAGVVRLGVQSEVELRQAYTEIMHNATRHAPQAQVLGVLVQEMVRGGVETIIGLSQDPLFGPVLLFGMGGIYTELYQDVALRACPITESDAHEMLQEVKGARLLEGFRGHPAADVDALIQLLVRISQLGIQCEQEVRELDLNPLLVLPRGQGVRAADALIVLA
jgi:acetyltransferase